MHDVIIIGAGPAGLSASVYLSRYKLDHVIIGPQVGGYMMETELIENYLGYKSITGAELSLKMREHAEALGGKIIPEAVTKISKKENGFEVKTALGNTFEAKFVIYSIGTKHRTLGIPGEKELTGKGISYCATCDGPFFKDKNVVVVGGGNSAASAALVLAQHAKSVTLFYRREKLPALPSYRDELEKNEKVEVVCCTNLTKIKGTERVESVVLDTPYQESNEFKTDGVFIEIGSNPKTDLVKNIGVELDEANYIKTNSDQSTNISGFYAAGDVTTNSNRFRQIVTAAAEGSIAAISIFENLREI